MRTMVCGGGGSPRTYMFRVNNNRGKDKQTFHYDLWVNSISVGCLPVTAVLGKVCVTEPSM